MLRESSFRFPFSGVLCCSDFCRANAQPSNSLFAISTLYLSHGADTHRDSRNHKTLYIPSICAIKICNIRKSSNFFRGNGECCDAPQLQSPLRCLRESCCSAKPRPLWLPFPHILSSTGKSPNYRKRNKLSQRTDGRTVLLWQRRGELFFCARDELIYCEECLSRQ